MGMVLQDFWAGGGRTPDPWHFNKAKVHATLVFGSDTWVMKPRIGRTLGGFHYRVDCCMEGMKLTWDIAGQW